jgi:AraC-like DNA-binding protein
MIGAVLQPAGATAFFDLPAYELTETRLDFGLVRHGEARELRERIGNSPTPAAKVHILEDYLLQKLHRRGYEPRGLDRLANAIQAQHGLLAMDELLATAFMSRRTFERRFLRTVGLSPKYYARICRISRICYLLSQSQAVDWPHLIGKGDYYDQAHFCKDFKSFMGASPSIYAKRNTELHRFLHPAES